VAEIENPVASRVIVPRIAFLERRVKAATEHAATRYEIARRTLVGTKRVEPPVAMAPRDAKAMKAETIRFACEMKAARTKKRGIVRLVCGFEMDGV